MNKDNEFGHTTTISRTVATTIATEATTKRISLLDESVTGESTGLEVVRLSRPSLIHRG